MGRWGRGKLLHGADGGCTPLSTDRYGGARSVDIEIVDNESTL